jgi:hypothetical protein
MENSKIIDNMIESYAYDEIALPFAESPFDIQVIKTI